MNPLFTIGHSTHELPKFLGLLKQHQIEVVADVRSNPVSRFSCYCQDRLKQELRQEGIKYVFLGTELGARRDEPECYVGNRADYDRIARTAGYRRGIERLQHGIVLYRVVLMCSEREPLDCHRTILVCRTAKDFATIQHIRADGSLEAHPHAEDRLVERYYAGNVDYLQDMLGESYRKRSLEINYVKPTEATVIRDEPPDNEY